MTRNIVLMSLDIKQVAEFDIPEFEDNPEVIMWDGRAFTTKHGCALNVYFEAPLYVIPQEIRTVVIDEQGVREIARDS